MFTLTYTPDAYRAADNILPIGDNRYESRPGFFQVVSDNVNRAFGWNDACVMEIFGGVYVWHGNIFEPIADYQGKPLNAGKRFSGSRFQALQSLGNREERIYVGNGDTLYYLHRNIIEGAEVTGVSVTPDTLDLTVGRSETLSAIIEPSWALNKKVTWASDAAGIVTVDEDGEVTALATGTATVTATTAEGGFTGSCTVTALPYVAVTGVTLEQDSLALAPEETARLAYTVEPANASNPAVYFRSSNPDIASVDTYGLVTARAEGSAVLHIYTTEGRFTDSCPLTVKASDASRYAPAPAAPMALSSGAAGKTAPPERFYEYVVFDNAFTDAEDKPYALPKARFLATWRNRLWAGDGTNIIYHCLNDNPHHWEPLDAIQIQGGAQSEVTGLCAMGNRLIVSTSATLWQIVGDSPYNWEYQCIVTGHGAINDRAMATDGNRLFYLDQKGVYELGKTEPVSTAIEDMFYAPDYDAQILLDDKGDYLYLLIHSRLFVLHTYSGLWGEIIPPYESVYPIKGLVLVGGVPGWYGDQGLWLQNVKYAPDVWLDGESRPVASRLRTWPVQPNPYGMTALNRAYIGVEGSWQGSVTYAVYEDIDSAPLARQTFTPWQQIPGHIIIQPTPDQVVYAEKSDRTYLESPLAVSWHQFEHELQFSGYTRLHSFEPVYQFTRRMSAS